MYTDPKAHASIGRHASCKGLELLLHAKCGVHRANRGLEHCENRVTRHVDDATVLQLDLRTEVLTGSVERVHGSLCVGSHQA
jgi:hypothetical protein